MTEAQAEKNDLIHIIDDDEAMRDSLSFLIASSGLKVETHPSADSFVFSGWRQAGCVITDVRMPGMSGVELLKRLKQDSKAVPVIVITGHGDVALAVEAMKAGAFDFLEKPFDDEQLLKAVSAALKWRGTAVEQEEKRRGIQSRLAALSERERQVLDGLVAGHPNKTIAYDLGISPRTVEVYRANLMTKLQASSLSEVVRMAVMASSAED